MNYTKVQCTFHNGEAANNVVTFFFPFFNNNRVHKGGHVTNQVAGSDGLTKFDCCWIKSAVANNMYALLTKLVRSRWLDIGQVLFCIFMDRDEVEVYKNTKKKPKKLPRKPKKPKKLRQNNFAFAGPTWAIPSGQDRPLMNFCYAIGIASMQCLVTRNNNYFVMLLSLRLLIHGQLS